MDPLTLSASVVSGLIVEALKEGGKLLVKDGPKLLHELILTVRQKFLEAGVSILLERVENAPTPRNIQVLEGEIIEQMSFDEQFLAKIQDLIAKIKSDEHFSNVQQLISDLENVENVEIGDVTQTSVNKNSSKQVIAEKLKNVTSIKIGNVSQNS